MDIHLAKVCGGHVYPARNLAAESPWTHAPGHEGLGESVALLLRHTLSRSS